jgi:hypothetical protein
MVASMSALMISRTWMVAAFALLMVSCFETKQEFVLNPDGSGKVIHECRFQEFNMNLNLGGGGGAQTDDEASLKRAVAEIMQKSKGVDAWDDVHFERLDDGRILFRATAWFSDLSKLEIENQMMMSFRWQRGPSGVGELAMAMKNDNDGENAAAQENAPPADEDGRRRWLAGERGKFQQARPMMASILGGMKHEAIFRLPGEAEESGLFEVADDGSLSIAFEGGKFLAAMDEMMADDAWLLEHGFESDGPPEIDGELAKMLFGRPGVPYASRGGLDEAMFDYQAELAAARANEEALRELLGSAAARAMPPAQGGPLASARIVGMRMVAQVDPALELRPFNHEAGLSLALLCEFDGAVLGISDQSAVESAVTSDGASLLPASDFQRRLRWPKFSPCRTFALFDVDLESPPAGAETLRDLAGSIHYSVSGGSKEIDLGFASIAKDEKGDELGAVITELKPGWREDGPLELSVKMDISVDDLKEMFLVSADDHRQELVRRGYGSSGNVTTFTFELPQEHAASARLVAEVHDDISNFTTQFILRNIPLPAVAGGEGDD